MFLKTKERWNQKTWKLPKFVLISNDGWFVKIGLGRTIVGSHSVLPYHGSTPNVTDIFKLSFQFGRNDQPIKWTIKMMK